MQVVVVVVCKQGARHVAKDIAGQGVANPTAALLAGAMMLRHLNLPDFSDRRGMLLSVVFRVRVSGVWSGT